LGGLYQFVHYNNLNTGGHLEIKERDCPDLFGKMPACRSFSAGRENGKKEKTILSIFHLPSNILHILFAAWSWFIQRIDIYMSYDSPKLDFGCLFGCNKTKQRDPGRAFWLLYF